ncbi:MAG: hypothetical protein HY318_08030 [Armatimonadetes bacterium]|nr:hypothetical protein [Armatimonadota bacterium]
MKPVRIDCSLVPAFLCLVVGASNVVAQKAGGGSLADQAKALKDQGKVQQALKQAQAAVHANQKDARAEYVLGWVLVKMNKRQEAVPHLQKALKLGITGDDATKAQGALQRLGSRASAGSAATGPSGTSPSPFVKPGAGPGGGKVSGPAAASGPPAGKAGPPGMTSGPPAGQTLPPSAPQGAPPVGKAGPPSLPAGGKSPTGAPAPPPEGKPEVAPSGPPGMEAPSGKSTPGTTETAPEDEGGGMPPIAIVVVGVVLLVILVAVRGALKKRKERLLSEESAGSDISAVDVTENQGALSSHDAGATLPLNQSDTSDTGGALDFDFGIPPQGQAQETSPQTGESSATEAISSFEVPDFTTTNLESAEPSSSEEKIDFGSSDFSFSLEEEAPKGEGEAPPKS